MILLVLSSWKFFDFLEGWIARSTAKERALVAFKEEGRFGRISDIMKRFAGMTLLN